MQKLALSAAVIIAFILYGLHQRNEDNAAQVVAPSSLSLATPTAEPSPTSTPSPSPSDNGAVPATYQPAPALTPSGKYKDGTYTGIAADAQYGNIQVQAAIAGGKIVKINFLQYPNDRNTSVRINQQAMPYLQQEAIQTQSAQVDAISGASDTSQAFIESLSTALKQAS